MKFNTFRNRLILIFMLLSTIPVIFLGSSIYLRTYEIRIADNEKAVYSSVISNIEYFERWIESKTSVIKSTCNIIDVLKIYDINEIDNYVNEINTKSETIEDIYSFIIDQNTGKMISNNDMDKDWYYSSYVNDKSLISNVHKDKFGVDVISFGYYHEKDSKKYVIATDIALDNLINKAVTLYYNEGVGIRIFVDDKDLYISNYIKSMNLERVKYNDTSAIVFEHDNDKYIGVYKKILGDMEIIVVDDFDNTIEDIDDLANSFAKFLIVLVILSAVLSYLISSRMTKPLSKVKSNIKKALLGESRVQIDYDDEDVFNNIYESFNTMASKDFDIYYEKLEKQEKIGHHNREILQISDDLEKSIESLKRINEDLNLSKKRYETLFENIKDLIWKIDINGNVTFFNEIFLDRLGYSMEEVEGAKFKSLIIGAYEIDNIDDLIYDMLRKDMVNQTIQIKKKNNKDYELVSFNSKRIIKNGKLIGTQCIGRTIIDKEILQKKMYKRNKELEFIKEISRTLTFSKNLDELLSNIAQKIGDLIETGVCSIWLLNDSNQLELKATAGKNKDLIGNKVICIDEDIAGEAILKNKVVIISSMEELKNKQYDNMENILEDLSELIFIPLEYNGVSNGVISIGVYSKLSEMDIGILSAFAGQSSVAIEKAKLYDKLKLDYFNTIKVLATAVEAKDSYTEGHSIRVSKFAVIIGEQLDMDELELEELEIAGILHDIGKIGIDDTILTKPGKLSDSEYFEIKKHPEIGARIIDPIELSTSIVEGVLYHHITYDGNGYPLDRDFKLGSKIPYIIGVADALDAMTSNRLYSRKKTIGDAIIELRKFSGTQFSPEIVDIVNYIFENEPDKLLEITEFGVKQIM